MSTLDVLLSCGYHVSASVAKETVSKLFAVNLLFNVATRRAAPSDALYHLSSTLFGALLLQLLLPETLTMVLFINAVMFVLLHAFHGLHKRAPTSSRPSLLFKISIIAIIICYEFLYEDHDHWLQCRGVVMILAMKYHSLAFLYGREEFPDFITCLGYTLCPANVLFGPWFPLSGYKKGGLSRRKTNLNWYKRVTVCTISSLAFVCISHCLSGGYVFDLSGRWTEAYVQALSFRTSHYFVSYLSEMCTVVAGFSTAPDESQWSYLVTDPSKIELPRSLTQVVIYWNIPMHAFLKKHVYQHWLPSGKFIAMLVTFFMSSLLHGLNIRVSLILLSIGTAAYAQKRAQKILGDYAKACIGVLPCKEQCCHRLKSDRWFCRVALAAFGLFTIAHLAYLGCIMDFEDDSGLAPIVDKWNGLGFFTHVVTALALVVGYFVTKVAT